MGKWFVAGGLVLLPRRRRRREAGPELGEREDFPRPTRHIEKFSAVHGGAHSRSTKQLVCDGAPTGLVFKVLHPLFLRPVLRWRWGLGTGDAVLHKDSRGFFVIFVLWGSFVYFLWDTCPSRAFFWLRVLYSCLLVS
jgi:hypothetical protein